MKRTAFDVLADNIVNPKCDECGASVRPINPLIGPHLCARCQSINDAESRARMRDYLSQERPRNRRVHVVKLPDGM